MKKYLISALFVFTSFQSWADQTPCESAINNLNKNMSSVAYNRLSSNSLKSVMARTTFSKNKKLQAEAASATEAMDQKVNQKISSDQQKVMSACNGTNMCASSVTSLIKSAQDRAQSSENALIMSQMVKSLDQNDPSRNAIIQAAIQIKTEAAALNDSLLAEALSECTSAPH